MPILRLCIGGSMAACGLKSDRKGGEDFGDNNFELFLDHFHRMQRQYQL
jgi:hypothetical protein